MKRSSLVLVAVLLLLCAHTPLAAGAIQPPPRQAPIESASLPGLEATIADDPQSAEVETPPTPNGLSIERTSPPPLDYPRLSLGTYWIKDWLGKPEGLAFLYQFQEIYGPSTTEDVLTVKRLARADDHGAWAANTTWIQGDCLVTTEDWTTKPPEWAFGLARSNVMEAISIAVYMNRQHQVDWFLRDIRGEKMRIWSDEHFALNLTPDCPVGAWDGMITYQGHPYSLGDTRGLTFVQWLKGPFTQAVIRNSRFSLAFDGLQAEDYPSRWLYYFNGQIPDPKRDGVGFPSDEAFEAYCRNVWRSWFLDFLKPLQDTFIIRINNHHTRWYFDRLQNPWPEIQQAANGCKLERYFGAGGWPSWDQPQWEDVYHVVEQLYRPLNSNPSAPAFDGRQGWDVTTVQLNAPFDWPSDRIDQYKRAGLASTLMGDGLFDGTAYVEDYYYTEYLRQGRTEYAPRDIPQMRIPLGRALGSSRVHWADPRRPLEYRQFLNADTGTLYTVVSNVWDVAVAGIPAEDGVWFVGRWPNGKYERMPNALIPPGRDSVQVGEEKTRRDVAPAGAPLTLRVVPSVTSARARLAFSAPVTAAVELRIVGVDGRVVRRLVVSEGQQEVAWDGRDLEGRRVAAGLYFAHAGDQSGGQTARVLIVR